MEESRFATIGDVILDESFPDLDVALRRGRHVDRDDGAWYALLVDAQAELETFYRRFGCELVHKTDGFFYLLPTGDRLPRRQLSVAEMLVGQGLALLLMDPCTVESGGAVDREGILAHLSRIMGPTALMKALNPKRKKLDERVAQENVRARVSEALRKLTSLGFVQPLEGDRIRLRTPLMRFAEPVRGSESAAQTLEKLVASGELALGTPEADETEDDGLEPAPDENTDATSPERSAEHATRRDDSDSNEVDEAVSPSEQNEPSDTSIDASNPKADAQNGLPQEELSEGTLDLFASADDTEESHR